MSNLKDFNCVKKIRDSNSPCQEKTCRHWLSCKKELNCSIIAAEEGPKTLQEIGDYYGISRMRICQIEKSLIEKLKNSKFFKEFDPSS